MDGAGGVLIVDDNPTIIGLLGAVLRDAGFTVRAAREGARALEIVAARAPELVLLDLVMPEMDGFEVCRRLQQDPATAAIPVIVISAVGDVEEKVRAFDSGAADYVTKPFEPREVLSRVGAHIQLYRLRRALAEQNHELQRKNHELEQAERRTRHVFSALAAALPGTVLDGKYRLDQKIGAGGFATVFRAEHLDLNRPVAVKVFRPWEGNDSPAALQAFRREGASACRVQHPNAVTVLDCGISSSGIAYLVMELLRGVTVAELLKASGPVPLPRCIDIMVPVCEVLAAAHTAGLVHRDIKPDNVFLHRTRGAEVVKVLDFGIAKLLQDADARGEATQETRGVVGTPAYVSPERVLGLDYDGRADVYSAGVMIYRLLTGRLPFAVTGGLLTHVTEPLPPLAVPGLPEAFDALLRSALAKSAGERPSAGELARALLQLRAN